ncbi:MAG: Uma2 family endonuclease [Synechococcales bacterium]|nr:Uma2 family endonuclease [Synechococcales bacterium]
MVSTPLPWTTRDLTVMSDDDGWKRYEIIDGELYVTRAPHIRHQGVASQLNIRLGIWSEQTGLGKIFQTPGVIFTPIDAVIPDLVWVSHDRLETGIDEAGHLTVAPELVVEILSPGEQNHQRDKEVKLKLYSRHGVQEYWIVNWQLKTIELYRHQDGILQLVCTLLSSDTLTSPLLPGLSVAIETLFDSRR